MAFDPIANGWRKLLNRSTKTETVASGTLTAPQTTLDPIELVAGQMYTVTIDGTEIGTYPAKYMGDESGELHYIGNLSILAFGENTGEKILIATGSGICFFVYEDFGESELPFSITTTETVHTIDQKYLYPRVELTTIATLEGAPLSADEVEVLEKAIENGQFVLSCKIDAGGADNVFEVEGIAQKISASDMLMYAVTVDIVMMKIAIALQYVDDTWVVMGIYSDAS